MLGTCFSSSLSTVLSWTIKRNLLCISGSTEVDLQRILSASSPSFPCWTTADLIAWPGSLSFSPSSSSAPCRPCPFQRVAPPSPPRADPVPAASVCLTWQMHSWGRSPRLRAEHHSPLQPQIRLTFCSLTPVLISALFLNFRKGYQRSSSN